MIDKGREFHKAMHDGRNDRRFSSEQHKAFQLFYCAEFDLLASKQKLELPVVEDPGPYPIARTRKACTDGASRLAFASGFSLTHLCWKAIARLAGEYCTYIQRVTKSQTNT